MLSFYWPRDFTQVLPVTYVICSSIRQQSAVSCFYSIVMQLYPQVLSRMNMVKGPATQSNVNFDGLLIILQIVGRRISRGFHESR